MGLHHLAQRVYNYAALKKYGLWGWNDAYFGHNAEKCGLLALGPVPNDMTCCIVMLLMLATLQRYVVLNLMTQ